MLRTPSLLASLALAACAAGDDLQDALDDETQTVINDDPDFVYVYTNNVENLESPGDFCPGDWKDLIWEMKSDVASPDLFLVQQIGGRAQLDQLVAFMTEHLHGVYAGVIAEADPAPQASPCGGQKRFQTNAIIYRVGRFEPVGPKEVWQAQARIDGACRRNTQARTKTVMQKLRDKVSGRHVTAASMHWATAQGGGADPACARANMVELDAKLRSPGYRAALTIWGGDTNEPDRTATGFRPWYALANGDRGGALGYRDVIYRKCANGDGAVRACLDDNWTIGSGNRIDYLFARARDELPAQGRAHTVTFEEADAAAAQVAGADAAANYSDHRAIRARIAY
jgi:hypothetical protein